MNADAPALGDDLSAAILVELAQAQARAGVSLPWLGKRLGTGASVLMRRLSAMSDASIGGITGPGWVVVTQRDKGWVVALTDAGKRVAVGPGRARAEPGASIRSP